VLLAPPPAVISPQLVVLPLPLPLAVAVAVSGGALFSYQAYCTEAAYSTPDSNIPSFLAAEHQITNQLHYIPPR
jgi:hypothetical protein